MKVIVKDNSIIGVSDYEPDNKPSDLLYMDMPDDFEFASANDYTLVDGALVVDPVAALARRKTVKIREIRAYFDVVINGIKASVAQYEVATWDTQRVEYTTHLADSAAPTPYIDSLATARGIDRLELLAKVGAKISALATVQGKQHALEKIVEECVSVAEIDGVVVSV